MLERDPRRLAAWAAAALVLALLAAWYLARSRPTASAALPASAQTIAVGTPAAAAVGDRAVVDVAGAVKHPGVYRLTTSDRVEDALRRAGGPTHRADLSQLNRAAKLEDGRQILVPVHARTAGAPSAAPAGTTAP